MGRKIGKNQCSWNFLWWQLGTYGRSETTGILEGLLQN
jgi:hypothetical protein